MFDFDDKFADDYKTSIVSADLVNPITGERTPTDFILMETSAMILKHRRTQLGYTQQQVANAAKIHLRQYQRLESGERNMADASMRIGIAICAVLHLDPRRFVPFTGLVDE